VSLVKIKCQLIFGLQQLLFILQKSPYSMLYKQRRSSQWSACSKYSLFTCSL